MPAKHGTGWLAAALALLPCAGCSTPVRTYYAAVETAVDTRFGLLGDNGLYHDVLYGPDVIALNFEGYVVGLDKSPRERVGAATAPGAADGLYDGQAQEGMARTIARLREDPKAHYVSHIVWNAGRPFGDGNCYLHSIYEYRAMDPDSPAQLAPLAQPCRGAILRDPSAAFPDSFAAIDTLASSIRDRIGSGRRYTHAVIAVMGWNTPQIEAIRNFNSLAANLRRAAGGGTAFDPLFIGVTWSSFWDQTWFDALVRLASYPNKANDADEVGASWLGYLVARVSEAAPRLPRVVIGHSFGARAATMAVCMGSQFNGAHAFARRAARGQNPPAKVDLLIALQPAVSINRFLEDGGADEIVYPGSCDNARRVVATASAGDEAVRSALWADMAGSTDSWKEACGEKRGRFMRPLECIRARPDGSTEPASGSVTGSFVYVDASRLVYFNHPNTGGGAHSDIYRPETGRFMWQWFPGP